MRVRSMGVALLLVGCGVMLGTSSGPGQACGVGACSTGDDCAPIACACRDGETRGSAACVTSRGCCATGSDTCSAECKPYGGWIGGGGSGGSGGAGDGGAVPDAGDPCTQIGLVCGCDPDGGCDTVLACSEGVYTPSLACTDGGCVTHDDNAACGTATFFTPYAIGGSACTGKQQNACTTDGHYLLQCVNGTWEQSVDCTSAAVKCGAIEPGDAGCPGPGFCVGCI